VGDPLTVPFGNKYGGGILVERAIDRYHNSIRNYAGVAISGIRSLGELKAIKALGGTMVFVDAPFDIRYKRMVDRQRDAESQITIEEFKAREESELSSGVADADFNIARISELADLRLINQTTLEEFYQIAEKALFS
jgi:dephospho-CoA kinase